MADFSQQLDTLTERQGEVLKALEGVAEELKGAATAEDVTRLKAQLDGYSAEMATLTAERTVRERDALVERTAAEVLAIRETLESQRKPSKAGVIGTARSIASGTPEAGFLWAVWAARNTRSPEFHALGKAILEEMGSYWSDVPAESKATLGTTAASGGNTVPAATLAGFREIQTAENIYRRLLTVTPVGFVSAVDVPTEGLAPARATVVAYGETKPNVDKTFNKYTATMYTIARIHDVGNQLLRNSRGVVESNVRSALARAFALGESYYILSGSGTSEPKGILTSIGTSGQFVSSFSPSATTLAGSVASAVATAAGAIANRSITPTGAVVNAAEFWTMVAQGTDTAGFFIAPTPRDVDPTGLRVTLWGLDVLGDPNMTADNLVVGGFRSAELFTGETYRVDVSDQAGDRWDKNLTGFRGEEEIGFNADPYVATGHFQRITNLIA